MCLCTLFLQKLMVTSRPLLLRIKSPFASKDSGQNSFVLACWTDVGGLRVDFVDTDTSKAYSRVATRDDVVGMLHNWAGTLMESHPSESRDLFQQLVFLAFENFERCVTLTPSHSSRSDNLLLEWSFDQSFLAGNSQQNTQPTDAAIQLPTSVFGTLLLTRVELQPTLTHVFTRTFFDMQATIQKISNLTNTLSGLQRNYVDAIARSQRALQEREKKEEAIFTALSLLLSTKKDRIALLEKRIQESREKISKNTAKISALEEAVGIDVKNEIEDDEADSLANGDSDDEANCVKVKVAESSDEDVALLSNNQSAVLSLSTPSFQSAKTGTTISQQISSAPPQVYVKREQQQQQHESPPHGKRTSNGSTGALAFDDVDDKVAIRPRKKTKF